jgi:hypothetical protein
MTYVDAVEKLTRMCTSMIDTYVVDGVLKPLARTIALK